MYKALGFYLGDIFDFALTTLNLNILDIFLLILCISAVLFYCYGIYAAIAFLRRHPINQNFHPSITILKPICGLDSDTYKNLASFCQQNYPDYQIIFSVRESHDPGIAVVKQIIEEFPKLDIQLIISDRTIGTNFKVSNLENAVTAAKHEILLIADSDIRVGSNYLQKVVQPLHDPSVGVVTCLYRTIAQNWVTILEAIATATDFHASVLVSNQLEGIKFAFGSTIVIRKHVLQEIGGFEAIADYLADDYQLGYLPAKAGYKVVLSDYVVEHVLAPTTIINAINHQTRWIRCIRVSRPWGYVGLIFTYGTVTSMLFLITADRSILSWNVMIITWITRLIMGWVVGVKILNDPVAKRYLWLIPLRDFMSFVIWCYGFFGTTIEWRGRRLRLTKEGKLVAM
jgi:ceramide glucosyltransferase